MAKPESNTPEPAAEPNQPEPQPQPAPPPAAKTVIDGESLEVVALRRQLEEKDRLIKQAQTDASWAQDEVQRLKTIPVMAVPKAKRGRWTLLHEDSDEA